MSYQDCEAVSLLGAAPAGASKATIYAGVALGCLCVSMAAVTADRTLSATTLYAPVAQQSSTAVRPATLSRGAAINAGSVAARKEASVLMGARTESADAAPMAFQAATAAPASVFAPLSLLMAGLVGLAALFRVSTKAAPVSTSRPRRMIMAAAAGLSQDELKKMVGYKAVDDHVRSGMVVGLGTGSTAAFAVERVGELYNSGELKDIICIPTSERTMEQAKELGIPLCTLNEKSHIDVSIDGADEVDPDWNLVKGGGGALLREKMVEIVSDKFICIVDESKLCPGLGPGFPLPVEITPFCHEHTMRIVAALPAIAPHLDKAVLRMGTSSSNVPDGDNIAVTDNGNYIVDLHFKEVIADSPAAASQLMNTIGVVDHGLFINMATEVIVAGAEGVYIMEKR